ncbi:hypothetical protein BRADI_2g50065v3 [Brachypodium distachyon]|uniref:Uncharacterized protein n=1 Tax=Brachypodium distachyon TaxID=15368 RepID=A0A2K2DF50_BRADI|nr:hypothetical protein BRADI_2g50065v3 [Brachypodium distachyon]
MGHPPAEFMILDVRFPWWVTLWVFVRSIHGAICTSRHDLLHAVVLMCPSLARTSSINRRCYSRKSTHSLVIFREIIFDG